MTDERTPDKLLRGLLGPGEPEIGCEECFEFLDLYVDRERTGADAEAAVPGMRAHLAGCPACEDDRKALHAWLDSSPP